MKYATFIAAGLLMLGACTKHRIKGDGAIVSETRALAAFTQIDCEGSSNVNIVLDSVYQVIVTGYQNLVPVYETRSEDGILRLKYDDDYYNVKNDNIRVTVRTPIVEMLNLNGSGNISLGSGFSGNFNSRINGSGNLNLGSSAFRHAGYYVNGSGNIDALAAAADSAFVTISGSGNVNLSVTDYLSAQINGSGDVNYRGKPVVNTEINGSGKVRRIN